MPVTKRLITGIETFRLLSRNGDFEIRFSKRQQAALRISCYFFNLEHINQISSVASEKIRVSC